jgi:hypothetical protein
MTAILGLRGTGDWGTDERPKNFRETILFRQPNGMSPLTALLAKVGSEKTDDAEFAWWEELLDTIRVKVNGALNDSATALVVDSGGKNLVPGDLLMVEKADQASYDNEIIEVSVSTSDTALTIVRGAAGTVAAAIPDDANLTKIGNVYAEGTGSPTASTRNPTKSYNFCQIFKTSYELTESAKETKARTGDPLKNDKKRKMFDHSIAMEWAFLFGRRNEATGANGKPKRTTQGLRSFISTNVTIFDSTTNAFDEDTFTNAVSPCFNYNSGAGDERLILCGNGALNALNRAARDSQSSRINHTETIKLYGMNLQRWIMPQGQVYVKTHPLLNNHPIYTYSMFVIDPSNIKYRYLRDTKMQDNIQDNDSDTQKGQWISECGLELHHETTMAYLGNCT